MSRSASPAFGLVGRRAVRTGALTLPLVLSLSVAAQAHADGENAEVSVAEVEAGPPVEAQIVELTPPIEELQAPIHDLTVTTESEDGSLADATGPEERTVTLAADVLFEFDEAELSEDAETSLEETADILRADAEGETVHVDGYTDDVGEDDYNQALSEERAEAVEDHLSALLDDVDITFETEGHGSDNPVASNEIDGEDNPDGREKNRRVEVSFPQ